MARGLVLPLVTCAILVGAITAVTAVGWGFRGAERSLPMPMAISVQDASKALDGEVVFRRTFTVGAASTGGTVVAAGPQGMRVRLDEQELGRSEQANPSVLRGSIGWTSADSHTLTVTVPSSASAPTFGIAVDLPLKGGITYRVVSDGDWEFIAGAATAANQARPVRVVGDDSSTALAGAFASLPRGYRESKEPIFWVTYWSLVAAMVVACLAGPILRPSHLGQSEGLVVGLAAIMPSALYASAAFIITGCAGLGLSVAWILGLHIASLALFVTVLLAIGAAGSAVSRDAREHRAELQGYDAMLGRMDVVVACMRGLPASSQGDWMSRVDSLAEKIRCAATSTQSEEIDRAILVEIETLERSLSPNASPDGSACTMTVERIEALLLRREAVAMAARRAV